MKPAKPWSVSYCGAKGVNKSSSISSVSKTSLSWLSAFVLAKSISINRGRNRDTEQFNAGTASVVFFDPNRDLDPLNEDSPYYPFVGPRQPIEVYANGLPIYAGTITDWDLDYDFTTPGNRMTAQCADNFTVLANMTFAAWAPVEQLSGARITASLARPEISYQGPRSLDAGQSTLGGTPGGGSAYDVAQGTNVLSYLQRVAASEGGFLFMDHANILTFVDRSQNINMSSRSFSVWYTIISSTNLTAESWTYRSTID